MIAVCNIRADPHYRRAAFEGGLKRAGYLLRGSGSAQPSGPDDLLVQWNRKPSDESFAHGWEARGGTVIVCENGYIGADRQGRQLYAIAAHGHNGSGYHFVGDTDRFSMLGVPLQPWRHAAGEPVQHVLVCGQRGIGSKTMASPVSWESDAQRRLKKLTTRPLKIRRHPGNAKPESTLAEDLVDAWACAVWSSSSGVKALAAGYPVLYDAPHWIASACATKLEGVESPITDDARRARAMHVMSWGQWTVDEIEAGTPFTLLRENMGRGPVA